MAQAYKILYQGRGGQKRDLPRAARTAGPPTGRATLCRGARQHSVQTVLKKLLKIGRDLLNTVGAVKMRHNYELNKYPVDIDVDIIHIKVSRKLPKTHFYTFVMHSGYEHLYSPGAAQRKEIFMLKY